MDEEIFRITNNLTSILESNGDQIMTDYITKCVEKNEYACGEYFEEYKKEVEE